MPAPRDSWTEGQIFRLIEMWGDDTIQEQLEGSKCL